MAYPRMLAEIQRRRRLQDPEQYDNGSYQLIKLMGWKWWFKRRFEREYEIDRGHNKAPLYIDMANANIKLAIEADGDRYHTDILKEEWRDNFLTVRGWYVMHFRWVDLVHRPDECYEDIEDAYGALSDTSLTRPQQLDCLRSARRSRQNERRYAL